MVINEHIYYKSDIYLTFLLIMLKNNAILQQIYTKLFNKRYFNGIVMNN